MKDLQKRIDRLSSGSAPDLQRILHLIDAGTYYDELSAEEKAAYCRYRGFDGAGFEALNGAYAEAMGIDPAEVRTKLERNPTPEQQKEMLAEFDRWVKEEQERFNSPEEVAKREAEYEELQRTGR